MKMPVRSIPSTSQKRKGEPSWSLIRLVSPTGTTKKRPTASSSEKAIVRPQTQPPISSCSPSSSSSIWALAEIASARKPIFIDSPRATTPRMTGRRQSAVALRPGDERLGLDLDLALGGADGDGPDRDAAHHHALEHRLAADRRVALGDQRAVGHAQRVASVRLEEIGRVPGAEPTLRAHGLLPGLACLAARRWKRSTRPPVSTSFCLPV